MIACTVRQDVAPQVSEFFPEHPVHPSPRHVSDEDDEPEPIRADVEMDEPVPLQTKDGGQPAKALTDDSGPSALGLHLRDEDIEEAL